MRSLIAACSLALVWGCSSAQLRSDLHTLNGQTTRSGSPVTNGGLILIPELPDSDGRVFNARVRQDGSFSAQTVLNESDGAVTKPGIPAGRYRVIYHPPGDGSKSGLEVELDQRVIVEPTTENSVVIVIPERLPEGDGRPRDDK